MQPGLFAALIPAMTSPNWIDLPTASLRKAPWNYKTENAGMSRKLRANLKRNGFVQNLIVRTLPDGAFEVVNGNHRLDAALELKIETVHCYNLGDIPLAKAQRLAVETNETFFPSNSLKLAKLVTDLLGDPDMPDVEDTLPFSKNERDAMLALTKFDFAEATTRPEVTSHTVSFEITEQLKTRWEAFLAGRKFKTQAEAFAALVRFGNTYRAAYLVRTPGQKSSLPSPMPA